jgi:hypothetical protein
MATMPNEIEPVHTGRGMPSSVPLFVLAPQDAAPVTISTEDFGQICPKSLVEIAT